MSSNLGACRGRMACAAVILSALLILTSQGWPMDDPPVEYLSDILPNRLYCLLQGWGELGLDTSAHAPGQKPLPLQIGTKQYAKGLGHHANGEVDIALDGEYSLFETEVGVLWQGGNVGSVVFQVFVDGEKRFDSGVMRERDAAKPVSVSVVGAQLLRLVATDAGDGITCDCACWCDARLTRTPDAKAVKPAALDIAPFGRVVTFDPHRQDGARANRVQEFAQEDVYLATDVRPGADGKYTVPTVADGTGCLGLQWAERRMLRSVGLELPDGTVWPDGARLEVWAGESPWQGNWQAVEGQPERDGNLWRWSVKRRSGLPLQVGGVQKVRWVFPRSPAPIAVKRLVAFSCSVCKDVPLRLESDRSLGGQHAEVEVYNGAFVGTAELQRVWDMRRPFALTVRASQPMPLKGDRTVLRFRVAGAPNATPHAFAVAIEDVLEHGSVWVPSAGVYVTRDPDGPTLKAYRRSLAGRETVLERVRKLPDQTFAQAWAKVHDPVQDYGPMLLSLACDNHKIQVQREGAIQFSTAPDVPESGGVDYCVELSPRFGSGRNEGLTRHVDGEWQPIPVTTARDGSVTYTQRTFVAPNGAEGKPLGVVEFCATNTGGQAATASVALALLADRTQNLPAQVVAAPGGFVARQGTRVLAYVKPGGVRLSAGPGKIEAATDLAAGATGRLVAYLPMGETTPEACSGLPPAEELLAATRSYWERQFAGSMKVDLPDAFLTNLIKASQVHCLLAARSESDGQRVAAWISSDRYGPLESEAHSVVLGMDEFGHHDFARRALDYFVRRYNPAGYLTTGYTVMGTGWHLWTLARHYGLTADDAWLRAVAPEVTRACEWIVRQRAKTLATAQDGPDAAQWGLMPPGVVADWGLFSNRYYMDANYCAGLSEAAAALKAIGGPEAARLSREAEAYRGALRHSYAWTQARTPVRALQDGTWCPASVGMAGCFGTVGEMFPGEDGGRTWATDAEIGPHQLIALGVLDPRSAEAGWIMDELEDHWCLATGMGGYPAEENHRDWFDFGGFPKIQPYYGRMPQVYALQDEVKPFIRSYLNAIPSLAGAEVLSFWEHFHNQGGWNKTHETGGFLQQTRTMLVNERGEELWLAPFVTNAWLQDGMTVSVENAPTRFGPVSYRIRSSVSQGFIEARLRLPTRARPQAVVLRLRHPDGKPMRSVTVNGKPHHDFDARREVVRLADTGEECVVRASY